MTMFELCATGSLQCRLSAQTRAPPYPWSEIGGQSSPRERISLARYISNPIHSVIRRTGRLKIIALRAELAYRVLRFCLRGLHGECHETYESQGGDRLNDLNTSPRAPVRLQGFTCSAGLD